MNGSTILFPANIVTGKVIEVTPTQLPHTTSLSSASFPPAAKAVVEALGEPPLPSGMDTGMDGTLPPAVGLLLVALIGLVLVTRRGRSRVDHTH